MPNQIDQFLKHHNMHADDVNVEHLCNLFLEEMKTGLMGEHSSLAMYPSFLTVSSAALSITTDKKITAVDVGGTHIRVANIDVKKNGHISIEKLESFAMIGKQSEFSANEFFQYLAEIIAPYALQSNGIGISFAFPGTVTPDRDLMIQEMAKEIHVNGIEGESLRNHLNDAFREMYQKEFLIIAVNDSVASLLGAVAGKDVGQYGSLTGLIVGTGTNTCYLEQTHQIGKITSFESPTDLINMESGSFSQYIGGDFDRLLDINSELPGDHLFEKMVGGKYLGRIVHLTALAAQKEKIISQDYALTFLQDSTAKDINVLLKNKTDDNDFALVKQIANNFVKRASKLLAANLWATIKQQGNFEHPALISAEGTTFEKTYGLREAITNELAIHTNGLPIEWVSVPNAVVIGSALAASKYC